MGKTLLVQMLRSMLSADQYRIAHLVFPQMEADQLLAYLADEFSADTEAVGGSPGTGASVRRIQRFLAQNAEEGRHAVAVVDEAHSIASPAVLDALRLLLNFEASGHPAISLVFVGQIGLLTTMDRTPQLEERLDVQCLLRPFSRSETASYVTHRLRTAGAVREVFAEDALQTLHDLTQGVPRRINRLCDLALLIGFAEERDSISAAHLESVQCELVAVAPE